MKIRMAMLVSPVKERQENAKKIKEVLPELVLIPVDAKSVDLFDAHLSILRDLGHGTDGVLMMEDDIILCKNFRPLLKQILIEHKDDVVQFFEYALAKQMPSRGYQSGSKFFSCVCYYMPSDVIKLVTDDATIDEFRNVVFPKKHEPWGYPIDTYISYALQKNKIKYWREIPYIVQHQNFKSTIGNRSTKRQSKYYIDDLQGET